MASKAHGFSTLDDCRSWFAEELRYAANVRNEAIIEAFATVPRERFLGPGPWEVLSAGPGSTGYRTTPDDDPAHVYHNVMIALDARRGLNNGLPASWAFWLDAVQPRLGDQVLHIGCGTGYYTAILAELVGGTGSVVGFELDPALADRARGHLLDWPNTHVITGDGATFEYQQSDLIVVSAGAATLPLAWLNGLGPGGRLLVPLTTRSVGRDDDGLMLRIDATPHGLSARRVSPARFFPCIGTQEQDAADRLAAALQRADATSIRSVRLDPHEPDGQCWLHAEHFCLSCRPLPTR